MEDTTDRNKNGSITAVLGAGAIVAAGSASQFDGTLYYVALTAGAVICIGALVGLYQLRYS